VSREVATDEGRCVDQQMRDFLGAIAFSEPALRKSFFKP